MLCLSVRSYFFVTMKFFFSRSLTDACFSSGMIDVQEGKALKQRPVMNLHDGKGVAVNFRQEQPDLAPDQAVSSSKSNPSASGRKLKRGGRQTASRGTRSKKPTKNSMPKRVRSSGVEDEPPGKKSRTLGKEAGEPWPPFRGLVCELLRDINCARDKKGLGMFSVHTCASFMKWLSPGLEDFSICSSYYATYATMRIKVPIHLHYLLYSIILTCLFISLVPYSMMYNTCSTMRHVRGQSVEGQIHFTS